MYRLQGMEKYELGAYRAMTCLRFRIIGRVDKLRRQLLKSSPHHEYQPRYSPAIIQARLTKTILPSKGNYSVSIVVTMINPNRR